MRLVPATAALLVGGAATAAAYWAFLNTPESTVPALLLSALFVVMALALLSLTINIAIDVWISGVSAAGLRRALPRLASIIPAALVAVLFWWIAGRIDTWVALRTGEINAWFMARFGWDNVSWLFTGIRAVTIWLRWVPASLLAVSLMAGIASAGWRAMVMPAWLRRALRPRTLALATAWFVVLMVLPWAYLVPWRPQWLPPTSAEMAFIIAKLSIATVLIAVGAALIMYEAVRLPMPPTDPRSEELAA
jgi:hypothetical protein